MRVVIFTPCRKAVAQNGLLNITDSFSNLLIPRTPVRATFTLATRLFFSSEEEGSFSGSIRFMDPDGHILMENQIELEVPIFEADATGIYIDSVGAFQTTLHTGGEFQFQIGPKNGEPAVFPFYVEVKSS